MEFKIDPWYVAMQSIKAIIGYVIGVCVVLFLIKVDEPLVFISESLIGCITLYLITIFPRTIRIKDGTISYVNKYTPVRDKRVFVLG